MGRGKTLFINAGTGTSNKETSLQFLHELLVKEGGLLVPAHSRQLTSGIRIPTSFAAVVEEWGNANVKKEVSN
jgi:hypothetical protein